MEGKERKDGETKTEGRGELLLKHVPVNFAYWMFGGSMWCVEGEFWW